jgi:sporulation protein YlmC with PRC-barrel domain
MSEATQLILGSETFCSDGACGEITRVVLDPVTRMVSHLVVEPKHRQGLGRMISWVLLDVSTAGILLKCTSAEFDTFDHAEETLFLPGTGGRAAYVAGHPLPQPYEGLVDVIGEVPQPVTYDTIPQGEVELRGAELVEATDGEIGRVRGLDVDWDSGQVVYLLVYESHVWGRRELAIPIEDVAVIADGIRLNIAKSEVQRCLPASLTRGAERATTPRKRALKTAQGINTGSTTLPECDRDERVRDV